MANSFLKDPQAVLDYEWDWSEWLDADTISAHTVTAPTGLTVASSSRTSTAVTAWLSGGTAGTSYAVVCHVTTAGGRQDDRTVQVTVEDR